MKKITMKEAQSHLPQILEMVSQGEEVVITRSGVEVVILTQIEKSNSAVQEVDWSESLLSIREHLKEMPEVGHSTVLVERGSYRW